jgi:NarL family two-component system response regulator LiaR
VQIVETVAGDTPDGSSDIALFDTFAGRRHAIERVRSMLADRDIAKVVLYTWDAPQAFLDDLTSMRIDAVILKSETGERLVDSLERVHRGEPVGIDRTSSRLPPTVLTEREREVLALIAMGRSNREIADELYLSIDTVKTHVRTLLRKLRVANRTQAAMEATQFRLTAPASRT